MKTKFKFSKLFRPKQRKTLAATAARRPLRIAAADYEEIAEPNMKLSRALLIVLLLHVVAVTGIIAFNAIKTRQTSLPAATAAAMPVSEETKSKARPAESARPSAASREPAKPARSETKSTSKTGKLAPNSGKVYVVARGDNPVTIAKKFKVSYDDLLALNHIDDPRKLQIGQKLLIPAKSAKGNKEE